MLLNEIRIGGIYRAKLNVTFRSEKEVHAVDFFVRVIGKTSQGNLEISFLNDNAVYYLEPHQLSSIT